MSEKPQSCGTCRWWVNTDGQRFGNCGFIIPKLPIWYDEQGDDYPMYDHEGTTCPTWEKPT